MDPEAMSKNVNLFAMKGEGQQMGQQMEWAGSSALATAHTVSRLTLCPLPSAAAYPAFIIHLLGIKTDLRDGQAWK